MSGLKYVGRAPDSDFSVIPKSYVDARYATVKVDTAYINSQVASQGSDLVNQAYVDTADGLRAQKTNVDSLDANYVPNTSIGAANGVVPLDNNAYIASTYLPTLSTNRKPIYVPATSVSLSGTRVVTTTNAKEYLAATLTVTDPGFPYIPMLFARVGGGAVGVTPSAPNLGTPNYGQISILREDDTKWGRCLCTSSPGINHHLAIPFGDSTVTPTSVPPIQGTTTFNLYLGLWSGTTYTFTSAQFSFYALVYPGM